MTKNKKSKIRKNKKIEKEIKKQHIINNDRNLKFSFVNINIRDNKNFCITNCNINHFHKFLERIKDLSSENIDKLRREYDRTRRFHRIDWNDERVVPDGFGLSPEFDDEAWYFSLTVNKGRVCGYLMDNIFYVVWIDPEHRVYPGKKK